MRPGAGVLHRRRAHADLGGGVSKKKKKDTKEFAKQFAEALADNEECMGDGAAYLVTCEQMGVDPNYGYDLLLELGEE
jgi:hypothetical protein